MAVWEAAAGGKQTQFIGACNKNGIFCDGRKIKGIRYNGSLSEVNPATGAVIWQRGLSGPILATPSLDGGHVIAAASFGSTTNHNGLWLIDAGTGRVLKTFSHTDSDTFGQPVFADKFLFVASTLTGLTANGRR